MSKKTKTKIKSKVRVRSKNKASPKVKTKRRFQAPRGMRDILPIEQVYWEKIEQTVKNLARNYGFSRIETPILEETDLFVKGTGAFTDIVEKEMYSLKTKGGDRLTLRPEFTPSIIRAYLENGLSGLPHPIKLYTLGPIFRYERPQKGRYRQSYQANFEVIGEKDSVLDAQLIQLFYAFSKELGLKNLTTQINSIGCPACRPAYRRTLLGFYKNQRREFCGNCQKRLQQNPLRLLDCKEIKCLRLAEEAPQIIDYFCDDCRNHFKSVLEFLDELEIPYILNPRLVRGLDYYTKTVFEFWPEGESGHQIALGGGGRYDGLVRLLGGKNTPAVGFAIGIDRIVNFMQENNIKVVTKTRPLFFLVQLGDLAKKKSLKLLEDLRRAGLETASSPSRNSIKAQLKTADKMKARFALILGQKEALDETIIIRDMMAGSQENVPLGKVINEVKKRLKT